MHPGVVSTEFFRAAPGMSYKPLYEIAKIIAWPFMKDPKSGSQTTIYCAVDEEIAKDSGKYYK